MVLFMSAYPTKIKVEEFITNERKRIAWGITGGGHWLKESVDKIKEFLNKGYILDIYFSRAGREVCKMFQELSHLQKLKEIYPNSLKFIFSEDQGWSFPICGSFSLKAYELLIISPTTANSVAKISYKIADTLITNIVSQSLKGNLPVIIIPTDFRKGSCETMAPGNKNITIIIHESDVQRTESLKNIRGIIVLEKPSDIIV